MAKPATLPLIPACGYPPYTKHGLERAIVNKLMP
jgi:hypothetical protein